MPKKKTKRTAAAIFEPDAKPGGLCHRCEHRARYYETGHAPRCECRGASYQPEGVIIQFAQVKTLADLRKLQARAKYLQESEELWKPQAVCGCYMYRPMRPAALKVNDGDSRPAFGPAMISARMHRVGLAKGNYRAKAQGDVLVAWFEPGEEDDAS